jgi:hypothetical protein
LINKCPLAVRSRFCIGRHIRFFNWDWTAAETTNEIQGQTMSWKSVRNGLLVVSFMLPLSALVWWLDVQLFRGALYQFRSSSFQAVEGVMVKCDITEREADEGTVSDLHVEYTYQVGNQTYTGHRVRYLKFWSGSWVSGFARDYPPSSPVIVYYDSDNPANAVLLPGLDETDLFSALFALPFNAILLGAVVAGVIGLLRSSSRLYPFGVRIVDRKDNVRIHLPNDALSRALAAPVAVALVCAVFIGLCCGVPPPLPLVAGAWILVLVAAAGAALQIVSSRLTGQFDLVIDFIEKTMTCQ